MARYYIYSYLETLKNMVLFAIPVFLKYLWINISVGAITAVVGYIIIYPNSSRCANSIISSILFIFEFFVIFYFYNLYGIYSIFSAFFVIFFIIIDRI